MLGLPNCEIAIGRMSSGEWVVLPNGDLHKVRVLLPQDDEGYMKALVVNYKDLVEKIEVLNSRYARAELSTVKKSLFRLLGFRKAQLKNCMRSIRTETKKLFSQSETIQYFRTGQGYKVLSSNEKDSFLAALAKADVFLVSVDSTEEQPKAA